MGGGGQQLQQLSQQLQAIDAEIEALETEIEALSTERAEIDEAVEALETLDSGSMVQVPLGGDAYLEAEIQDIDEVIVGLGGGYAAEQDRESAIDTLGHKQEVIAEQIDDLEADIEALEDESSDLETQAQAMQQRLQQQQQQQMAQMGQMQGDDE
ncbi:MAG: prefoldin subunit alpha [Natrialbaceae archaeon]